MFNSSKCIVVLLSLLFAYGCSQKGTNVKLEVTNNFVFGGTDTAAIAGGGLMVWGKNTQGASFGKAMEDSDEINVPLPNGTWTFYAMAWDGTKDYLGAGTTNYTLGGKVRCATSTVTLDGSAASVNLTVDNNNCTDSVFAGTIGTTGSAPNLALPSTKFNFCRGLGTISGPAQLCTDSHLDNRQRVRKATVNSFRVVLRNHMSLGGGRNLGTDGVKGQCVVFDGDVDTASQGGETLSHPSKYGRATIEIPGLPAGGAGVPFHATVEMFLSSDCDTNTTTARGVIRQELPNGIVSQNNIDNRYFVDGTSHRQYISVLADTVCNNRTATTLGGHPFAGGDGTRHRPYIICSVPQFHAINSNASFLLSNFKLSADLDFNPYSVGITANPLPPQFTCLEMGSNFMPLGYAAASCNTGTKVMTWNTVTPFSGTFDGGNFVMKNLRFRKDSLQYVGIFAKIYSSSQDIGNFHVDKAEIEGSDYVGLLAGHVDSAGTGTNEVFIRQITAEAIDVQARGSAAQSNVGGLVGYMEDGNLFQINIKKSTVRGDGSRVGGILGSTINVLLNHVGAEVDIENNSSINGKLDIGGVIGLANNTDMHFVKHEGGIYTDAHQVGGIVGSTTANSRLENFYTNSHIVTNSSSTAPKVGGVIGSWGSNAASPVGPGYTLSRMRTKCITGCTHGAVVGDIVTNPSTINDIYFLGDYEAVAGGNSTDFASGQISMTLAQMQSTTDLTAIAANVSGGYNWTFINGEYPRLDFENHPCVSGFSGTGAATLMSPKLICNTSQYTAMSSATSSNVYKLIANIRFLRNSPDNDITTFNGHLDGNRHSLIGGDATMNGNDGLAHIGTLNGSIRNLKVHGMSRAANSGSPTIPHGALVATNNGTLENIKIWSYPYFMYNGSGVVGHNTLTGQMKRIQFEGIVDGYGSLATLAYKNEGLIESVRASGEINCSHPTACNNIAGLVVENQGRIKRTELATRFMETASGVANVSMLVDTNEKIDLTKPGLIQDVLVSAHAEFKVTGSSVFYFHRQNLTGAKLERVANFGKLLHDDLFYASANDIAVNFPTAASAINAGGGTHVDTFRSGGRSGKLLVSNANFTCTANNIINIPDWGSMSDFASWDTAFGSGTYSGLVSLSDKRIVIEFTFPGDIKFTQQAIAYSNAASSYDFTIPTTQCGGPGKADIYYTNDIPVNVSGDGVSGAMLPQYASYPVNYGSTWEAMTYNYQVPADVTDLLNFYAFLTGQTSTPVTPRTWEMSDREISLFNLED